MKTWEMIKMLTENPKLKAKLQQENSSYTINVDNEGYFDNKNNSNNKIILSIQDEWEVVNEPVDFITALKEGYKNCKNIKCCINGDEYIYNYSNTVLRDQETKVITKNEILNGEWFIED